MQRLTDGGLFALLQELNSATPYRFTGIYRFAGPWVKSVKLFDRERPHVELGSDVLWDNSYCRMASEDGDMCEVADAPLDPRLETHVARLQVQSYIAVLLRNTDGSHYGTLCHYDVTPRSTPRAVAEDLRVVRPLVEEAIISTHSLMEHA